MFYVSPDFINALITELAESAKLLFDMFLK